jgi:hypothetical protein
MLMLNLCHTKLAAVYSCYTLSGSVWEHSFRSHPNQGHSYSVNRLKSSQLILWQVLVDRGMLADQFSVGNTTQRDKQSLVDLFLSVRPQILPNRSAAKKISGTIERRSLKWHNLQSSLIIHEYLQSLTTLEEIFFNCSVTFIQSQSIWLHNLTLSIHIYWEHSDLEHCVSCSETSGHNWAVGFESQCHVWLTGSSQNRVRRERRHAANHYVFNWYSVKILRSLNVLYTELLKASLFHWSKCCNWLAYKPALNE